MLLIFIYGLRACIMLEIIACASSTVYLGKGAMYFTSIFGNQGLTVAYRPENYELCKYLL